MTDAVPRSPTVLVLGGARSGKSRYAQGLAEASGRGLVFVATAESRDAEMQERIMRHREDRGPRWRTVEAPIALCDVLQETAAPDTVVLVDCLTLWLTNVVLGDTDPVAAVRGLTAAVERLAGSAIFVSNEVGQGIVPETPLGRRFRDEQGRLNQAMARACTSVVQVTAGLPVQLKPRPAPVIDGWG